MRRICFIVVLIINSLNLLAIENNRIRKLNESDSIYFQDIRNIEFSPNLKLYVVNQISKTNRINIFKGNDSLYKSYFIDDSFTFKFIDSIYYDDTEVLINSESYSSLAGSNTQTEFLNTVSHSTFLNDSTLITIGTLKYLVHYNDTPNRPHFKLNKVTVLLILDLNNDDFEIKPLRFNETNVNPQSTYIENINNDIYFELFPSGFLRKIKNSPKFVVGKINIDDFDWQPAVELPEEYVTSNIRLRIDFSYRISNYNKKIFFMSPLTNYLFSLEKDTIWLNDLVDPIMFSLKKHNSSRVSLPEEMFKLDSLSHSIVDIFFHSDFLYVVLNTPLYNDKKIYLHKYTLEGELIDSKELNDGKRIKTAFYSKNKQKLMKVYLKNEEWYVEEMDIN